MTDDNPKLVQFIHPGLEHGQDRPGWKEWNEQAHRRKFLEAPGRYVIDSHDALQQTSNMMFWGEWEAQSEVTRLATSGGHLPRWVHRPRLCSRRNSEQAQNTDPFVFGDRMLYTCCKQLLATGRPTGLRYLPRGSVILFGSHMGGAFCLDTIIVVSSYIDHTTGTWEDKLQGHVPDVYWSTTLLPVYANGDRTHNRLGIGWRMYQSATFGDRIGGMFSFVPARPVADVPEPFERPRVRLAGLITDGLKQGQKFTPLPPLTLHDAWLDVVEQVTGEDLVLATTLALPAADSMKEPAPPPSPGRTGRC